MENKEKSLKEKDWQIINYKEKLNIIFKKDLIYINLKADGNNIKLFLELIKKIENLKREKNDFLIKNVIFDLKRIKDIDAYGIILIYRLYFYLKKNINKKLNFKVLLGDKSLKIEKILKSVRLDYLFEIVK